jgi:hypothetical protein
MHLLIQTTAVAVVAAVLVICIGRERATKAVPVLSYVVPALFGLMYLFEQELGEMFGLVMLVPFLLLALTGALLSLVGLILVWKGREGVKGPRLVAAAIAATPALAICLL